MIDESHIKKWSPIVTVGLILFALALGGMLVRKWVLERALLQVTAEEAFSNFQQAEQPPNPAQRNPEPHERQPTAKRLDKLNQKQKQLLELFPYEAQQLNELLANDRDGNQHHDFLTRAINGRNKALLQAYFESFPQLPDSLRRLLEADENRFSYLMTCAINMGDANTISKIASATSTDVIRRSNSLSRISDLIEKAINNNDRALLRACWNFPLEVNTYAPFRVTVNSIPDFADEFMEYVANLPDGAVTRIADGTFENPLFREALLKSDSPSWANAFSKCSPSMRLDILPKALQAKNKRIALAVCMGSFETQSTNQLSWLTSPQENFRDLADELNAVNRQWPGALEENLSKVKPFEKLKAWCVGDLLNCTWFNHRERLQKWVGLCREKIANLQLIEFGGKTLFDYALDNKPWLIEWLDENKICEILEDKPEVQFYRAVKNRDRNTIKEMATIRFGRYRSNSRFSPEFFLVAARYEEGLRDILRDDFVFNRDPKVPQAINVAFRVCRDSAGQLEPTIPLLIAERGGIQSKESLSQLLRDDPTNVIKLIKEKPTFRMATGKFLPKLIVESMNQKKAPLARELFAALMLVEQDKQLSETSKLETLAEFLVSLQDGNLPTKVEDLRSAALGSPELIEDMLIHGFQFSFNDLLYAVERMPLESVKSLIQDPELRGLNASQLQLLSDRAKTRGDQKIVELLKTLE